MTLHVSWKDPVPLGQEEEVQVLFGSSGWPGAAIPAGGAHGQGCRTTPDRAHAGPGTGAGRRIPVHTLCTYMNVPLKKMGVKYVGEQVFKCIYLNFQFTLLHKTKKWLRSTTCQNATKF